MLLFAASERDAVTGITRHHATCAVNTGECVCCCLQAVRETLLPVLPDIMQRVQSTLADTNSVSRTDAQHVSSALMVCLLVFFYCQSYIFFTQTCNAKAPCGARTASFSLCPFTSSSFALFYFSLFSVALTVFFFRPSLSFLPE